MNGMAWRAATQTSLPAGHAAIRGQRLRVHAVAETEPAPMKIAPTRERLFMLPYDSSKLAFRKDAPERQPVPKNVGLEAKSHFYVDSTCISALLDTCPLTVCKSLRSAFAASVCA